MSSLEVLVQDKAGIASATSEEAHTIAANLNAEAAQAAAETLHDRGIFPVGDVERRRTLAIFMVVLALVAIGFGGGAFVLAVTGHAGGEAFLAIASAGVGAIGGVYSQR